MAAVYSFSYRFGPMPGHSPVALLLDARGVTNPYVHGEPDEVIRARVMESRVAQWMVERGVQYLTDVPNAAVYVGCSYGRHRSVAIAGEIAWRMGIEAEHLSPGANGERRG